MSHADAAAQFAGLSAAEFADDAYEFGKAVGCSADEAIAANRARNERIWDWFETEGTP